MTPARLHSDAPPRISVIVPVWREEARIAGLLRHLAEVFAGASCEAIVVDGDPGAGTLEALERALRRDPARAAEARRLRLRTLRAPRGRGRQLDAGARTARGEVLVFLHADTRLPAGAPAVIDAVLAGADAGAFSLRFDAPGRLYRLFEAIVNRGCSRGPGPFGDQALFVRREVYERVGGFRPLPILEDVEWVRRARRAGVRVRRARAAVVTSARRFEARGALRQALRNALVLAAGRLGVAPERLVRIYGVAGVAPSEPDSLGTDRSTRSRRLVLARRRARGAVASRIDGA